MTNRMLVSLFEYKAWANRGLLAALVAVPEGEHALPMMQIRILVDHMSVVDQLFRARLIGEPVPFEGTISQQTPSFGELTQTVARTDAWYTGYVGAVTPGALDETIDFVFTDGDKGHMTRGEMLGHVLTHANSHRGAIGQMMGSLKIKGAPDMVTSYLSGKR
jgi:uncharacterized damage-inducible protein DinB